ncbi:MAG: hypothetical protein AAFX94_22370 [Myxococcota bacterium]
MHGFTAGLLAGIGLAASIIAILVLANQVRARAPVVLHEPVPPEPTVPPEGQVERFRVTRVIAFLFGQLFLIAGLGGFAENHTYGLGAAGDFLSGVFSGFGGLVMLACFRGERSGMGDGS